MANGKMILAQRQTRSAQPVAWSAKEKVDVLRDLARNWFSATPYVVQRACKAGKTYTEFHHKKKMG